MVRVIAIVLLVTAIHAVSVAVKAACAGLLAMFLLRTLRIGNSGEESLEIFFGRNTLVSRIFLRVAGELLKFSVCRSAIRPQHSQG
jgi:hypothetical protein